MNLLATVKKAGLLEPGEEVGAVDVLRDDKAGELFGAADVMNWYDVRMVKGGDGAGLGQICFGVARLALLLTANRITTGTNRQKIDARSRYTPCQRVASSKI